MLYSGCVRVRMSERAILRVYIMRVCVHVRACLFVYCIHVCARACIMHVSLCEPMHARNVCVCKFVSVSYNFEIRIIYN